MTCSSMLLAARDEDGAPMSRAELRDELMTALVAGHETTASQLAWALRAHRPRARACSAACTRSSTTATTTPT